MKREFLQNFKVGDEALTKEIIDAIMDENGRDIEAEKSKYADYDALKAQLADAKKTSSGFEAMNIDDIKPTAAKWKEKAEQAERDAAEKIAQMEFDSDIDSAIRKANGRNPKAVKAMLDIASLKESKNRTDDINAALNALKESDGYLFYEKQTPPPYAAGTGSNANTLKNSPEINAFRAAAGLKTE